MAKQDKGDEKGRPPVAKLRDGNLTVDIWGNKRKVEGQKKSVVMYSVVLKRHYKDEEGDWHDNDNIPYQDGPRAAALLVAAYNKVVELRTPEVKDDEAIDDENE